MPVFDKDEGNTGTSTVATGDVLKTDANREGELATRHNSTLTEVFVHEIDVISLK